MRHLLLLILLLSPGLALAQKPEPVVACPANLSGFSGEGLECACPAGATASGTVWGSSPYTSDSALCRAARHAGVIGEAGGTLRARMGGPQPSFKGSTQNGVQTSDYGAYDGSFTFVAGGAASAPMACPTNMSSFSGTDALACVCPAPGNGLVWGSDLYTSDSHLCRAAQHAGFITPQGGPVRVRMAAGAARYSGSERNGVTTQNFGAYRASFRFEGEPVVAAPTGPTACPTTMQNAVAVNETLRCTCSAEAAARATSVWGSDAYTSDSQTCRAALHAGAVRREGGEVTIRMLGGLPRYVGTTRNGVTSQNYGPWAESFRFEGLTAGAQICPDNMTAYAGTTERLECLCTGEATLRQGSVWGSGPYTADSAVCRAARHAGVLPVTGGTAQVVMTGPEPRWPGSERNGVRTSDWAQYPAGFRFEGAQNTAAGAPVQAPIADALRRTGKVSLYITFKTGSADLDATATPVLTQLRDALAADPSLRLRLVGHTDSQGSAAANLPLSQRRAQSVASWLTRNGVPAARLATEGRGQTQPIADNTSEAGRSLNRRVEAERVD